MKLICTVVKVNSSSLKQAWQTKYASCLAINKTLLPDLYCEISARWHKTQSFAYLWGDTERGGDTLRGGDLLPLCAGLLDLDADLEADLQLNHASCHTQDAQSEHANG